jgi:hypothetical protein
MRRRIRVRGKQREDIELERLARALLQAAREAAKVTTTSVQELRDEK